MIYEKDKDSTIASQYDGDVLDIVNLEVYEIEIPVYEIKGSEQGTYYAGNFEYLNTYYSVSSNEDEKLFQKIIENIMIKSE